jgi:hypothetical protein
MFPPRLYCVVRFLLFLVLFVCMISIIIRGTDVASTYMSLRSVVAQFNALGYLCQNDSAFAWTITLFSQNRGQHLFLKISKTCHPLKHFSKHLNFKPSHSINQTIIFFRRKHLVFQTKLHFQIQSIFFLD